MRDGAIGELWVRGTRGVQLFLEYHDNAEANEKSFTADGWFKTGDMVRLGAEGNFFYRDRDKDALKGRRRTHVGARGRGIACRGVAGVADVAVVARSHEMLDMVPVAFVIRVRRGGRRRVREADHRAPKVEARGLQGPARCTSSTTSKATLDKVAKNKLREMAEEMPAPGRKRSPRCAW